MADETLITRFSTNLEALDLFEPFSEDSMNHRPLANAWSAHENLAHLGHYHETFAERVQRILSEDVPVLERYRAEDHAGFGDWTALPTSEVIADMKTLRAKLNRTLASLTPDAFTRVGTHPVYGRLSLARWLEFFLAHEGHHIYVALLRAGQARQELESK